MINSLLPINGDVSIYRDCCIAVNDKNQKPAVVLDVAKCFLNNAILTCDAILEGRISAFDPIVGENACQVRALVAIASYLDEDLKAKLIDLKEKVEGLLKLLPTLKPDNRKMENLPEQLKSLGLSLSVTEKIDYLLRSHFLTVGKHFEMNRDGKEISGIKAVKIQKKLSTDVSGNRLNNIVKIAQEKISQDSVKYIQMEAEGLQGIFLMEGKIPETGKKLHSTCSFYNLKVVLQQVNKRNIPILVKEYGSEKPRGIYFRSEKLLEGNLEDNQPLLVVECFFSDRCDEKEILRHGIMDLILANVACTKEYTADEDIRLLEPEAQEEILKYRTLGKELGCYTASPAVFKVVHVHAATAKEEKVV